MSTYRHCVSAMPEAIITNVGGRQCYQGRLAIPVDARLGDEHARVEAQLAQLVEQVALADPAYDALPETKGGKIINADLYRELHPCYAEGSLADRQVLTRATTNPAKAGSQDRFARQLTACAASAQLKVVLAGGSGAGKTTTLRQMPELLSHADLIYDTTLSRPEDLTFVLARAHAAQLKKPLTIIYVHRPFADAVAGMIQRAKADGRYIPLVGMVANHAGAIANMHDLIKNHQHAASVRVLIRNNGDPQFSDSQIDPIEFCGTVTTDRPEMLYVAHRVLSRFPDLSAELRRSLAPDQRP